MKIKYHCSSYFDNTALVELLEKAKVRIDILEPRSIYNSFVFDIDSDNPFCSEALARVKLDPDPFIIETAIYSQKEMDDAQWYTMEATRSMVGTTNFDFTYECCCEYHTSCETRYYHCVQVRPFVTKSIPKWKTRFHFCSSDGGDFSLIFCSNEARKSLIENQIAGLDFLPVLKGDLTTVRDEIYQLDYLHTIDMDAFTPIGSYYEDICPVCGEKKLIFQKPMADNLRINREKLPEGIDIFVSSRNFFYQGWGPRTVVVSKKVYNLIAKDLKEKHVRFIPIG